MKIETFEAAVERAADPPAIWRALTAVFKGTVVQRILYHHLPPLGSDDAGKIGVAAEGFPEEIVAKYVGEEMYRRNPLLGYAQQSAEPFYFDEITSLRSLSAREAEWVRSVQEAGYANGLGVQVFGPGGRNGYFGLGFVPGVTRLDPSDPPRMQGICQAAHLRYCAQILAMQDAPPTLSEREKDVLVWVARGKSNAAIGEILGISAHTVDAHLRRIYLKLGVYDRITAAVRGIGLGLVHSNL